MITHDLTGVAGPAGPPGASGVQVNTVQPKSLGYATTGSIAAGDNTITGLASIDGYDEGDWVSIVGAGPLQAGGAPGDLSGQIVAMTSNTFDLVDSLGAPVSAAFAVSGAVVFPNARHVIQDAMAGRTELYIPPDEVGYGWPYQETCLVPASIRKLVGYATIIAPQGSYPLGGSGRLFKTESDTIGGSLITDGLSVEDFWFKGTLQAIDENNPVSLGLLNYAAFRIAAPSGVNQNYAPWFRRCKVTDWPGQGLLIQQGTKGGFDRCVVDRCQRGSLLWFFYCSHMKALDCEVYGSNDDAIANNSGSTNIPHSHPDPFDLEILGGVYESRQESTLITNQAVSIRGGKDVRIDCEARGGKYTSFLVQHHGRPDLGGTLYSPDDVVVNGKSVNSTGSGYTVEGPRVGSVTLKGKVTSARENAVVLLAKNQYSLVGKFDKVTVDVESEDVGMELDDTPAATGPHAHLYVACDSGAEITSLIVPRLEAVRPRREAISILAGAIIRHMRIRGVEVIDGNWSGATGIDAMLLQGILDLDLDGFAIYETAANPAGVAYTTARYEQGLHTTDISGAQVGRMKNGHGAQADFHGAASGTHPGRPFIRNDSAGVGDQLGHIIDGKPARATGKISLKNLDKITHGLYRDPTSWGVHPTADDRIVSAALSGAVGATQIQVTLRTHTAAAVTVAEPVTWWAEVSA